MNMEINYKGKKYKVEEPTIEIWSKLVVLQEWTDEREFAIRLLSFITGLTEEEIEQSDVIEVLNAASDISNYLMLESKVFHSEFEFEGKRYKFLDLSNLTFGEFVDIDSYISKTEAEKKKDLNLFMAMLYRELDDNGNFIPYNSNDMVKRAEIFKKLPIKYVNGASTFFLLTEKILSNNTRLYSWQKLKMKMKAIWTLKKLLVLTIIGGGLLLLSRWRMKILRR